MLQSIIFEEAQLCDLLLVEPHEYALNVYWKGQCHKNMKSSGAIKNLTDCFCPLSVEIDFHSWFKDGSRPWSCPSDVYIFANTTPIHLRYFCRVASWFHPFYQRRWAPSIPISEDTEPETIIWLILKLWRQAQRHLLSNSKFAERFQPWAAMDEHESKYPGTVFNALRETHKYIMYNFEKMERRQLNTLL